MKKNKWLKYGAIGAVFIFLVLIVLLVMNIGDKVNIEYDDRVSVFGLWKIKNYELYVEGDLIESIDGYNQVSMAFYEENIEFCYNIDDKWDCFSHNYWIKDNILTVYLFSSDEMETKFEYKIDNNTLVLRDGDDKNYTISTFVKIG